MQRIHLYLIAFLSIILLLIVTVLIVYACLRKRIICIRREKSETTETVHDVLVFGKTYEVSYELAVKKCKIGKYSVILLPRDTPITLEVIICQCEQVQFVMDFELSDNIIEENDEDYVFVHDNIHLSFPVCQDSYKEGIPKTSLISNKTFSVSCAICLDEFRFKDKTLVLKCHHGFHKNCIIKAFHENPVCPCCQDRNSVTIIQLRNKIPVPSLGSSYGSIGSLR